jgi:hypothetical protein
MNYLLINKFKYVSIVVGLAMALGCGTSQPATSTTKEELPPRDPAKDRAETVEDEMQSMKYRLIISFISIGEGPDFNAKSGLDRAVAEWEKRKGKSLKQEQYPWGREGEVDYCFQLLELTSNEQQEFIKELTTTIGTSKLVQISENQPCMHKR